MGRNILLVHKSDVFTVHLKPVSSFLLIKQPTDRQTDDKRKREIGNCETSRKYEIHQNNPITKLSQLTLGK